MNIPQISIERETENNPYGFYVGRDLKTGQVLAIGYSFLEVIMNYTRAIYKGKVNI